MRIEQLKYLAALANTRSISIAAKNLYVSESNISKAIKSLEDEFGFRLFDRSTTEVHLTPDALILLPFMTDVVDEYYNLIMKANMIATSTPAKMSGSLNIMAEPVIANVLFPEALACFLKRYPGVTVNILNENFDNISKAMLNKDVDLVFMKSINDYTQHSVDTKELVFTVLFYEKLFLLANANSSIAYRKMIDFTDITDCYVITTNNNILCYEDIFQIITKQKYQPKLLIKTNNHHLIKRLLEKDMAVCIVSNLSLRSVFAQSPNIKAIPLNHHFKTEIGYLSQRHSTKKPLIDEFIKIIKLVNHL